jgi:anti-sigma regulatory factor (Ser/Thr protein kinase)
MVDEPADTLILPSRLDRMDEARRWMTERLAPLGLNEEWLIDLELALTEAISNVIRHAYGGEEDHEVHLRLGVHGDRVTLEIRDFGLPFERGTLPPVDLDSAHDGGYGVYLMENLVDDVVRAPVSPRGTRLQLTKLRPR